MSAASTTMPPLPLAASSCFVHTQNLPDGQTASAFYSCHHCEVTCHKGRLAEDTCEPPSGQGHCHKPPEKDSEQVKIALQGVPVKTDIPLCYNSRVFCPIKVVEDTKTC